MSEIDVAKLYNSYNRSGLFTLGSSVIYTNTETNILYAQKRYFQNNCAETVNSQNIFSILLFKIFNISNDVFAFISKMPCLYQAILIDTPARKV